MDIFLFFSFGFNSFRFEQQKLLGPSFVLILGMVSPSAKMSNQETSRIKEIF